MLPRLPLRDARDRLVVFVNLGRAKRIEKSYSVVWRADFGKNFEVGKRLHISNLAKSERVRKPTRCFAHKLRCKDGLLASHIHLAQNF